MGRKAQALVVVLSGVLLAGCGEDSPGGSAAPTAAATTAGPTSAPTTPAAAASTAATTPTTVSKDEGVVFALLRKDKPPREGPGLDLAYDKLAYIADCGGEEFTVAYGLEREFRACWRNDNDLVRTVPLAASAKVTAIDQEGDSVGFDADELAIVLSDETIRRPLRFSVFKLTITKGTVVAVTELQEARLSTADERLAR